MYELGIEEVIKTVEREGYRLIGIQLPEGLKERAIGIAEEMEKTGCGTIISADPCYGACDLADRELEELGAEALFHFGHTKLPNKSRLPVFYIPVEITIDSLQSLEKHLEKLPKRLGLITTAQHLEQLKGVKGFLECKGFAVEIGAGKRVSKGQVLGCNFSAARDVKDRVDALLYIGGGQFHPLGAAIATGKRTYALDPVSGELKDIEELKERILKQRFARIEKAKAAESFGIIVGAKAGQRRAKLAVAVKKKIEREGKKAYLLCLRELTPNALMPFRNLDAFVSTACPRVAIDDASLFKRPLLTPKELEIALGEREWSAYELDEMA